MAKSKVTTAVESLGDYLKDQRVSAQMTLRQLSEQAGVSNPYLSQIERGLRPAFSRRTPGFGQGAADLC
ncbi:MAG: helix-turn-helix transcriptional regulator [Marmoricola sp.]